MPRHYLLLPKHELFRRHHERLSSRPDPALASRRFEQRLAFMQKVHGFRIAFFVALYFASATTAAGFLLRAVGDPFGIGAILGLLVSITSSLTALFLLGVLVTTRIVSWTEVELHYYSQETRLPPAKAPLT